MFEHHAVKMPADREFADDAVNRRIPIPDRAMPDPKGDRPYVYGDSSHRTWVDLSDESALEGLPWSRFRVLKMEHLVPRGMGARVPDGVNAGAAQTVALPNSLPRCKPS